MAAYPRILFCFEFIDALPKAPDVRIFVESAILGNQLSSVGIGGGPAEVVLIRRDEPHGRPENRACVRFSVLFFSFQGVLPAAWKQQRISSHSSVKFFRNSWAGVIAIGLPGTDLARRRS